jgi:hypothetical protein
VATIFDRTHNPFEETHWVSGLRENLTSRSDGEGLETGLRNTLNGHEGGNPGYSQGQSYGLPRQSFTRQVFFEDCKLYENWGQLAKQTGEEGSSRGLILSLLLDHCLLLHPEQTAHLENNLLACTVGRLCEKSRVEALLAFIRRMLDEDSPQARLRQLADQLEQIFPLRDSSKHMNGRDLGRIWPTPSLWSQAVAA